MMRNKMVWKLSGYFAASLIVFSIIISAIFFAFFRTNTIEIHKAELQERAKKISDTLSSVSNTNMQKGQNSGYGAYIKFLNDIAMADVWIVDENLDIITYGMGQHAVTTTNELPDNAKQIVDDVFAGETEFSESFSNMLDTPSLTVGTPIKAADGTIIGVVLLHSPINGINLATSKGLLILGYSITIALIITILLSVWLSYNFTKPLKRMNLAAIKLAEGDYTVKTDINQYDEIGTLANNIDVLAERLDEASKESEKLEGLRRDFIANISHELRTPIAVIRGSLEALADGVITEENQVHEYYSQMLSESKHLQTLVSDLLDLSKLQNMDFQLDMSTVSLCDLMNDVVRSAKSLASEKDISILYENTTVNCAVSGDYGKLRQMIMIIIDNAIKFSPKGGNIYIDLSQKDNLMLSIRDEGSGIAPENLPNIFDRFFKTTSEENKTGTGLGLAIAKQIAQRHNIDLEVFSTLGKGSEFVFTLKNIM